VAADIDTCIHAGQHGEPLHRLDDARRAPKVVEPRVHDEPIDCVHYE
jgi:hypothetical protein